MLARNTPEGVPIVPNNNTGQQRIGKISATSLPVGIPDGVRTIPTLLGGNIPVANSRRCADKTGTPELNPLEYLCSHKEPSEAVAQAVCQQLFGKVDCDAAMKSIKSDIDSACRQYERNKTQNKLSNQDDVIEDALNDLSKKDDEDVVSCIRRKTGDKEDLLQYLESEDGQKVIKECKKSIDSSSLEKANQEDSVSNQSKVLHDAPAPVVQMDDRPFAKSPAGITTIVLATALGGFFVYMGARIVVRMRA